MHLWLTWKRGQHCFPPWSSWCQLSWINVWKMPWVHKIKEALDDLVFAKESHNLLAVNAKVFETLQSPSVKCREVLSFSEKWRDNSLYSGLMLESEEGGSLCFLCETWIIHLKSTPAFSLGGCDKWQLQQSFVVFFFFIPVNCFFASFISCMVLAVLDTDSAKRSPPLNFLPYKKTGQLFLWPTSCKSYRAEFLEGESKEKNETLALVSEQKCMQNLVW